MDLYTGGKRRIAPALRFGLGVLLHLARHGRSYDVVHTSSFPYFSLLAAASVRPVGRYQLTVDWFEVWSKEYWRHYLGRIPGQLGWTVQRLCALVPQTAYVFSRRYAERLERLGLRRKPRLLTGMFGGSLTVGAAGLPARTPPTVVFAGRLIPEKRVPLVVDAIVAARERIPDLEGCIFGAGPDAQVVAERIAAAGLENAIAIPGFVDAAVVEDAISTATCLLQTSSREGYGLVVVEAASHGVPVVVVDGLDNAAVELVSEGRNGFVVARPAASALADAIVACHDAGQPLRAAAYRWYEENADRLSIESSLSVVVDGYSRTAVK